MITFLDGVRLPDLCLQGFQFEVVGTEYEESDKVFGFVNQGNASGFNGYADNLMVFSRALTATELVALFSPRVNCVRCDTMLLVHRSVDFNGDTLQAKEALLGTNQWTAVTNQPIVVGNQYVVLQEISGPSRFYRLIRPGEASMAGR